MITRITRRLLLGSAAVLAVLAGGSLSLVRAGGPAAGVVEPSSPTIAQFMKIRVPGGLIAHGDTMYVTDWPDGINQLYRVDAPSGVADKNATYTRLTNFPDGISSATLSPDGKTLLATAARGGNERTQIYLLSPNAAGADVAPLITNDKANISPNVWLKDSSGFIYTANDESPNDFYIYKHDLTPGAANPTPLLKKPGSWGAADVTEDTSRVIVGQFRSASDSDMFELVVATGELRPLDPTEEPHANDPVGYMPGEAGVLYVSDVEEGRARLFLRDLATGKVSKPLPDLDAYEIDAATINRDRSLLAVTLNMDGFGVLRLYNLPSFEPAPLPEIEKGVVGGARFRDRTLFWNVSNARQPGITYSYDVPVNTRIKMMPIAQQRTAIVDDQGIDLASMRLPELVKYKSFDGLEIPAFLYLPAGAQKGSPIPFVVNFHGGPEGQFRPSFSRTNQFLLARGYGILEPNVRGSTGYGRAFHMLDDYKNRWHSVKDGVEAARFLVREGYARAGKIAVQGGSYGGYMVNATLVEDGSSPDPVIGAGCTVVGIVNLQTFLEQTSGYRRKLREAEYGPLSDPEFLKSASPIHRVDDIKVPMMIAHGLNDPRVPVGEAMQLAVSLKKRGLEPLELYFPDEGHGFAKLENRLLFNEQLVKFLDKHIGGK